MENLDKVFTVYKHTFPNGKVYIGITRERPNKRWGRGSNYYGQLVFRAIVKYGWDNIKHEILQTGLTQEEAEQYERALIAFYDSANRAHGYNIALGGNHKGKHSPETIEKIRAKNIGHKVTEETRRKISAANFARGPEWRAKLAENARNMTAETKAKISKSLTGKKQSAETKKKRADKLRGIKRSDDVIQRMTQAQRNRSQEWEDKRIASVRKMCFKPVCKVAPSGEVLAVYGSVTEAAKVNGLRISPVSRVCRGERKTYKGFIWKYKEDDLWQKTEKN